MIFDKFIDLLHLIFISVLFPAVVLIGCESNMDQSGETRQKHELTTVTNQIPKVKIGGAIFEVELAINPSERALGLSGRDILEENTGMLFIFSQDSATQFWMYGMKFPLDLIWISNSCKVVDITYDAKNPENPNSSENLVLYSSKSPATYTLEINAGEADLNNIKIGSLVDFLNFPKENIVDCQ
tara:strand:+ start:11977 stop:12528 length:552 start_codon:yes stop_codon:yes gene_type:complete